jgi:hypothetical protein
VRRNPSQQRGDDTADRRLDATSEWERGNGCRAKIERDGYEVGDRYHLIA